MKRPWRVGLAGAIAGATGVVLFAIGRARPDWVEALYSRSVYPWIARGLAAVSGWLPLSLFEILVAALLIAVVALPLAAYLRERRRRRGSVAAAIGVGACWLVALLGGVWLVFLLVWGLNYAREPVDRTFRLGPSPDGVQTRRWVALVGQRLDRLRAGLTEDARGVVRLPEDLGALDRQIARLQARVLRSRGLPAVAGGRTKSFLASRMLLRWRVSGVYGPFTGEPNLVLPAPPGLLPFVIAHERAHLSGIAHEDAASYVALRTLWASRDPRLRYSGWLELWLHLGGSTRGRHPGVVRDILAVREFSQRHAGWERPLVRTVYDAYLRSHGVPGGTRSYGRVAGLALRHLEMYGAPDPPGTLRHLPVEASDPEAPGP